MKKFVLLMTILLASIFSLFSNASSREISPGEMRFINLSPSQIIGVHFKGLRGRTCVVLIRTIQDGRETFSEEIKFDQHQEERHILIGKNKMTVFYIPRGLTVLLDGKEV